MRNTQRYLDDMGKEVLEIRKINETRKLKRMEIQKQKLEKITIQSTTRSRGGRSSTVGERKE